MKVKNRWWLNWRILSHNFEQSGEEKNENIPRRCIFGKCTFSFILYGRRSNPGLWTVWQQFWATERQAFGRLQMKTSWIQRIRMDIWWWTQRVKSFETNINIHQKASTIENRVEQQHRILVAQNRVVASTIEQTKKKRKKLVDISQHCFDQWAIQF